MVKLLSRIAVAAALVATAASSHAYIRLGVGQLGSGIAFACDTRNLASCGTLLNTFVDGAVTTYTFDAFSAVGDSGLQRFIVTREVGRADLVTFRGLVGDYEVRGTEATSNSPGTSLEATASNTAIRVGRLTSDLAGDFFVGVQAFDFASPIGVDKTIFGSSGMSSTGSTLAGSMLTASFWADANNTGAAVAATKVDCDYFLSTDDSCSTDTKVWTDAPGTGGGLFSLRSEYELKLAVGEGIEGTTTVIVRNVPEPMTLSLVGAALLGVAAAARRRANKA